MKYGYYNLTIPLQFIQSGEFICESSWVHPKSTRKMDTEVMIGLEESIKLQVAGEVFKLDKGSVLTIFPGETIEGLEEAPINAKFIWFHFTNQSTVHYSDYLSQNKLSSECIIPRFFKPEPIEKIMILASEMLDITHSQSNIISQNYEISLLMSEISQNFIQQTIHSHIKEGLMIQIKEWINANIFNEIKVNNIAYQFNISQDYLSREFKNLYGTTVINYINKMRINYARYFLLTTDMSVYQIAEKCSFTDYKYFFRVFKKYTNTTPLHYRNAFTNAYLNNPNVDYGFDVGKAIHLLEKGLPTSIIF